MVPGQNFRPLVHHGAVIPHIVKRVSIIKRAVDVADVMLRHFVFFAVSAVVEDGFLGNFMLQSVLV